MQWVQMGHVFSQFYGIVRDLLAQVVCSPCDSEYERSWCYICLPVYNFLLYSVQQSWKDPKLFVWSKMHEVTISRQWSSSSGAQWAADTSQKVSRWKSRTNTYFTHNLTVLFMGSQHFTFKFFPHILLSLAKILSYTYTENPCGFQVHLWGTSFPVTLYS